MFMIRFLITIISKSHSDNWENEMKEEIKAEANI